MSGGPGPSADLIEDATAFEARPVRPGLRQGDLVEVSGLREGEEVVTAGAHLLKSELQKERIAGGE